MRIRDTGGVQEASVDLCELVHHEPLGAFLASARNGLGVLIET